MDGGARWWWSRLLRAPLWAALQLYKQTETPGKCARANMRSSLNRQNTDGHKGRGHKKNAIAAAAVVVVYGG